MSNCSTMTTHSVYRIVVDSAIYLVLAPSEQAAIRCLWETEGTSEEEWREDNDIETVGVVHPDKWASIFMKEDEVGEPLKSISAVVAETKLSADQAEVLCSSEY